MPNSLTLSLPDEAATLAFAGKLASLMGNQGVIFLHGVLGAGKTTFSRGFLRGLGYAGVVKSPTYTLVEPYVLQNGSVFHFDLYRVQNPLELEYMGIRDYFVPQAICLVEWPEHGQGILPDPDLSCYIELQPEGRKIKILAGSARGQEIVKQLLS